MVKPCSPFIDHNKGNPTANQRAELSYRDLLLTQGIHDSMGAMGTPGEAGGKPLEQYTNNSMAQLQNTDKMAASKLTNPTKWDKHMTMDETKWMWTGVRQDKNRINYTTQKHLENKKYRFLINDINEIDLFLFKID